MTSQYLLAQQLEARVERRKVWRQAIPLARVAWSKLSPREIESSEGNVSFLAGLIQRRYGVGHEEALRQVMTFMNTLPAAA